MIDRKVDGEAFDADLDAHLGTCGTCRSELESRARLKRALSALRLPAPPRAFDRALLAPARRTWWPATAAAAAMIVLFLGSVPRATPEVFAATRLHEDVLAGRVTLGNLGLRPTTTRADIPSGCPCPPDLGPSSPFVVYGRGDGAVSCLALEDDRPRSPAWFQLGGHTVLVRSRLGLLEVWVSRLDRPALASWIGTRDSGDGPRRSLRDFTCRACCELLESRSGSKDPVSLDLVVAADGGRVDPDRLVGRLRPAVMNNR